MSRVLSLVLCGLSFVGVPLTAGAQALPENIQRVDAALRGSRYNARRLENPTVAVSIIDARGATAGAFEVRVTTQADNVVTFVTLVRKANIRRTDELCDRLLKLNYDFDYVKVGFDDDDDIYVRMDNRPRFVDAREMNEAIQQVINVAETTYARISPFLTR